MSTLESADRHNRYSPSFEARPIRSSPQILIRHVYVIPFFARICSAVCAAFTSPDATFGPRYWRINASTCDVLSVFSISGKEVGTSAAATHERLWRKYAPYLFVHSPVDFLGPRLGGRKCVRRLPAGLSHHVAGRAGARRNGRKYELGPLL